MNDSSDELEDSIDLLDDLNEIFRIQRECLKKGQHSLEITLLKSVIRSLPTFLAKNRKIWTLRYIKAFQNKLKITNPDIFISANDIFNTALDHQLVSKFKSTFESNFNLGQLLELAIFIQLEDSVDNSELLDAVYEQYKIVLQVTRPALYEIIS